VIALKSEAVKVAAPFVDPSAAAFAMDKVGAADPRTVIVCEVDSGADTVTVCLFASVITPVLLSVASPESATPVATFDVFPTKMFPLTRVEVCLPLKVVQSVLVRKPFTEPVAAGIEMVFVDLESGLVNNSGFSFPLKAVQSPELR
jgi:hypothetical protein